MKNHNRFRAAQLAEYAKVIADMLASRANESAELVIADALQPLLLPEMVEPLDPEGHVDAGDCLKEGPWSFHGHEVIES